MTKTPNSDLVHKLRRVACGNSLLTQGDMLAGLAAARMTEMVAEIKRLRELCRKVERLLDGPTINRAWYSDEEAACIKRFKFRLRAAAEGKSGQ